MTRLHLVLNTKLPTPSTQPSRNEPGRSLQQLLMYIRLVYEGSCPAQAFPIPTCPGCEGFKGPEIADLPSSVHASELQVFCSSALILRLPHLQREAIYTTMFLRVGQSTANCSSSDTHEHLFWGVPLPHCVRASVLRHVLLKLLNC